MSVSKNRRRKDKRAEYYKAANESGEKLQQLKEVFFQNIDTTIDNMDLNDPNDDRVDEHAFIRDILKAIEKNGWVTVFRLGMTPLQIKADIYEYISSRTNSAEAGANHQRALAAQHLFDRAISSIQPKRI
ncbi:hypothetical protein BVX94_01610 [bacterium B17]|nr:hypothetical protein BVX94_01610 [bacterium B17]